MLVSKGSEGTYHAFSLNRAVLTNPFHEWIEAAIRLPKSICVRNNERHHSPKCFPARGQCQHHRFKVVLDIQTAYSPPASVMPEQPLNGRVPFNFPCLGTALLKEKFDIFDGAFHSRNCIAHAVVHGRDAMGVTPIMTESRVRPAYNMHKEAYLLD